MRALAAPALLFAIVHGIAWGAVYDLAGHPKNSFASEARVRVFLFVRTDCPITNRYAPDLRQLAQDFAGRPVEFWLIYPDPAENAQVITNHLAQYSLPGQPLRDPLHELVKRAQARVAPESAVFDQKGNLIYHGRIDDRWAAPGVERPAAHTHDLRAAILATLAGQPVAQASTQAFGCSLADVQ